ncbi:MAG: carboxypeptidase regulatory-like domain-containing protein [Chitinophagaceae bacterium]
MTKPVLVFALVVAAITFLHARRIMESSTLTGKISPASAVHSIWVIHKEDSLKTSLTKDVFSLQLPPGQYKLIIDARAPYKQVIKEHVFTEEGKSTNVGEINLEQEDAISVRQ